MARMPKSSASARRGPGRLQAGRLAAALGLAAIVASPAGAQGLLPAPRIDGLVYADYFYNLDADSGSALARDLHGFRFRRILSTLEMDPDTATTIRLQLAADEEALTADGTIAVFVRQAFLRRDLGAAGHLVLGLSPAPLWRQTERVWAYRAVERTLLERLGLGVDTDLGIALERAPAEGRPLGWHLMFGNGSGQRPERDRGKRATVSLPVRVHDLVIEGLGDYENVPGDRDRYLLKLFTGWQGERVGAGIEAFRRVSLNSGADGADVPQAGMSVFARLRVRARWTPFLRYDFFDPDTEVDAAGYREQAWIGGLDYRAARNVQVIPNLLVRGFSRKSDTLPERDPDVVVQATVSYSWP